MRAMTAFLSVMAVYQVGGALPSEWESEYFCPRGACGRDIINRPGFSGPFATFHECCYIGTDRLARIQPWGVASPISRQELIDRGYHTDQCTEGQCLAPLTNHTRHRHNLGSDWHKATVMLGRTLPGRV